MLVVTCLRVRQALPTLSTVGKWSPLLFEEEKTTALGRSPRWGYSGLSRH
jgi:hypothetical protein